MAPRTPTNQRRLALLASLGGSLLLALIAQRYRVDLTRCRSWPAPSTNALFAALYLLALALLSWGWLRLIQEPWPRVRTVLALGLLAHLPALASPPFLSDDPLVYAAVGRAMTTFHQSPHTPLPQALPHDDPFISFLNIPALGASAYWAGFNQLSALVARLGGDSLPAHLRLYQLIGLLAMLGAAALAALAARRLLPEALAGPRAAALVLLCPLSIIEATGNAHNDALFALGAALFALLIAQRRAALALLPLLAGLLVKASALLPLALYALQLLLAPLPEALRRPLRRALPLLALLGLGAVLLLARTVPQLGVLGLFLGSPDQTVEWCTRSLECLPRAVLRWVLHAPRAAYAVGLLFRTAGILWLLHVALRSQRRSVLRWTATFLFFYYLYLHAWSQSWYLLPLLPLLPYASPRLYRAMLTLCISSVAYYALLFPFACVPLDLSTALVDLAEGVITVAPPTIVWLRGDDQGSSSYT